MVEFTGNSGNILPQIMLLAAWGSEERERDGGREREGKKKNQQARMVCRRRGKALKQQKQKEKGTCSRSASCSLAECGAVAFTRSQ